MKKRSTSRLGSTKSSRFTEGKSSRLAKSKSSRLGDKSSNYQSRVPERPKNVPPAPVEEPKKPGVPLPGVQEGKEGELLKHALYNKVQLLKYLIETVGNPVSVSIEVFEDEWALMVHGPNPGIRYFNGHKVFWARAKLLGR